MAEFSAVSPDYLRTQSEDPLFGEALVFPEAAGDVGQHKALDVLSIDADVMARQITLLDLSVFKRIRPEEFVDGAWICKEKSHKAPNIVEFTRRFNQVSLWTTREILYAQDHAQRVERLERFIKIAKKLHEHNNINGLLAVLSGLQNAPIHRLSQTWKSLPEKYVSRFDRLQRFSSESENFKVMREYLAVARLPCIPYLGMYLTDLMHIPQPPRASSADMHRRFTAIVDDLRRFQSSEYTFEIVGFIRHALEADRYSDDALKQIEKDNYRRSLEIEPKSADDPAMLASLVERVGIATPKKGSIPARLRPLGQGHRKARSLGSNAVTSIFGGGSRYTLLGEDEQHQQIVPNSAAPMSHTHFSPPPSPLTFRSPKSPSRLESEDEGSDDPDLPATPAHLSYDPVKNIDREGMLRRRTANRLFAIKRQWVVLSYPYVYLFSANRISGARSDRASYKAAPSSALHLEQCTVEADADKPEFRLGMPGVSVRFIADSTEDRDRWVHALQRAHDSPSRSARPSVGTILH